MGASQFGGAASLWGLTLSSLTPPLRAVTPLELCVCDLSIKSLSGSGPASVPQPSGHGGLTVLGTPIWHCLVVQAPRADSAEEALLRDLAVFCP